MSEFSVEFFLTIDRHWELEFMQYDAYDFSFNSEMIDLHECIDLPYSLRLGDYEQFQVLSDGDYRVYARGEAEYVPDVDWESGVDEGCWDLYMEKISIQKFEKDKDPESEELFTDD